MIEALGKVTERMHFPLAAMVTCVRWHVAYPPSLGLIDETLAGCGTYVDQAYSSVRPTATELLGYGRIVRGE